MRLGKATKVSWAFKAPISMALLPVFASATNSFKFVHVIRDGRDIAFSGNQKTVEYYYDLVYPKENKDKAESKGFSDDGFFSFYYQYYWG